MTAFLQRLHAKLGDFWWYSLMLFCACRAADCLNVFVGLWLVPKYVEPSELGAVMPLTNFAGFLAIPIGVFASTFRNELTTLAINRKFGQMKTLMRGVFVATAIFFFLAIVVCRFVLPAYLERIRVAEGSLGSVILISSFIGAIAPIYNNALQSLKKFKGSSTLALLGAPLRLITMLVMMPFRALTGYFVGQCAVPVSQIVGSVFCLHRELSVPAEPYWNREIVRRFGMLFLIFGASAVAGGIASLVETTVLRQRLPELDSAAYYMVTRFSDIAGFLASTLVFTLFPFTAELAAKGKDTRPLILKTSLAVLVTNAALAAFFWLFGERILTFLPHGSQYASFWWAIPWIIGITSITLYNNFYWTAEVSAFRFSCMVWWIPLNLLYAAALLLVTGYGYFTAYLPASWTDFLATHNITSLSAMLWWMTGIATLKALGCTLAMCKPTLAWNKSAPVRYLVVGGWNFAFGYGIFALLYWTFNGRWTDWFIATVATVLGITMSYLTHRFITYRSHGCWWKEYLRFYVVYGGQSLLNVFLIWLLVTQLQRNAYIVQLIINIALVVVSFWAHKLYSFKKQ